MRQLEEYNRLATLASVRSLLDCLSLTVIDSRPEPRAFRLLAEPWQVAQANTLAPAFEQLAGLRAGYSGPRRFWLEYPRGHDKSSGIGRMCNWLLAFAPRQNLRLQVAASDREQASLMADYMATEIGLNPWLAARLKPHKNRVYSQVNGGFLEILAADASGSYGGKPDVLLADELTHWPNDSLWNALYSGMAKRPDSIVVVTTNSGIKGTWQERVLNSAKRFPASWFVFQAPGQLASWMTPDKVTELAEGLPKGVARRVLYNQWVDPGEECGLCNRDEAERCVDPRLSRRHKAEPGVNYVASIDYGLVKDRTALCVMHADPDGRYVVDKLDVWQGSKGNPVHADDVQLWIEQAYASFGCSFVVDPYQLEPVIQRLSHLPVERYQYRGGKTNCEAASNVLALLRNGKLAWHPGCGDILLGGAPHTLADEFAECVVKTMPYGFRIDHESGRHDDRVTVVAMACLRLARDAPTAGLAEIDERFF